MGIIAGGRREVRVKAGRDYCCCCCLPMQPCQRLVGFATHIHIDAAVYGGAFRVATVAVVGRTLIAVEEYISVYRLGLYCHDAPVQRNGTQKDAIVTTLQFQLVDAVA